MATTNKASGARHGSLMGILRTPRIGQTYRELILNAPKTERDQNTNVFAYKKDADKQDHEKQTNFTIDQKKR